jgi:hypothetical protein
MNGAGEMMVEARCVVRILLTKLVDYIKVSLNSPHPYFSHEISSGRAPTAPVRRCRAH